MSKKGRMRYFLLSAGFIWIKAVFNNILIIGLSIYPLEDFVQLQSFPV